MLPEVDLVIAFRASRKTSVLKRHALEDARKAEKQYDRLIKTLSSAGLRAVGRRGESLGHLLVFVSCPKNLVHTLIKRERHSDFLYGLPTTPAKREEETQPLSPADRIRLVHAFITSMPMDGGLGISPDSPEWDLVESVMALHDREFNERWIHAWTTSRFVSVKQERLREQFGDAVAMYFSFLHTYTQALVFPAVLGVLFFFFGTPYSPIYSILIVLWSIVFVEWWRIRERILSLRFGTRGSFRVEKRRARYIDGFPWWKHELRMIASLPVILVFAAVLVSILTGIFVFEAFVTQLYTGPGHKYIAFSPTVLFVALVPRLLAVYQSIATRFTAWENHAHQSSHAASLTVKTFALSALVAYMGLALSAFVYVPFGEGIMRLCQVWLFKESVRADVTAEAFNVTSSLNATEHMKGMWNVDTSLAGQKLNAARLKEQMFAYTVTNQIVNTFMEIGLPYVLRAVESFRARKANGNGNGKGEKGKKRVVFEDEKEKGGAEEREFLECVRKEVALPEYELFGDYSEMVTQFGYVALWSTIWPLAPAMALLNNFFELRSDAFKITVHNRRPIPLRTDTIGPWLDTLSFLTWLAAVINSRSSTSSARARRTTATRRRARSTRCTSTSSLRRLRRAARAERCAQRRGDAELLMTAVLIALAASHGYMIVRAGVRHVMEKALWHASEEVRTRERGEREVKERFLTGLVGTADIGVNGRSVEGTEVKLDADVPATPVEGLASFWDHDEGVQEIQRITKEA
ncbi:calcium-activated chloride channel-domain-containing protein [Mycena leptocephala]|nr:calcium-activated chloride channel-domain-containing protein [Mycena leptocephala]